MVDDVARETADIAAGRVVLGEQLAAFREAADMRQGQLARLVFRDRTTLVHIEKGRARADEQFWAAADDAVKADGVLLTAFRELEAAKHVVEHEQRLEKPSNPDEEISMAADEAARIAQFAEQTNVGPHTLEQFQADIRRIVTQYPNRPVYPLFVELRTLRSRAFEKLEGRQFPTQTKDLYLITGVLCGVLANASFDLGRLDAAETQARTAFLCAELSGCNWLRAWIRGTQALIAYWDDRPLVAVQLAEDGRQYVPELGTASVRLEAIAARAYGRMRDARGVDTALGIAADARAAVVADDDPGGMMAFPEGKQSYTAASARLWLGGRGGASLAERDADHAVHLYEQDPPEQRRIGELTLARLDLAAARLARSELEGTAAEVRTVLEVARRRPLESVNRRLRQVDAVLAQPRYRNERLASDLRDEIGVAVGRAALPAFPSSETR